MILIIKTAPDKHLQKALALFGSGEKICLLVQPSSRERIRSEFPNCRIMLFPRDGMFEISHVTADFMRNMRKEKYSKVILLYNTKTRMFYDHLETLARAFDSPQVIGMYPDGSTEDLVATPFGTAKLKAQVAVGRIGISSNAGRVISSLLTFAYLHIHFKSIEFVEYLTRPVADVVRQRHKSRDKKY